MEALQEARELVHINVDGASHVGLRRDHGRQRRRDGQHAEARRRNCSFDVAPGSPRGVGVRPAASGGVFDCFGAVFGAAARFGASVAVFGAAGFGAPLAESRRRRPLIGESGVRVSGGGGGALLASAIARRQGVVILSLGFARRPTRRAAQELG